MSKEIASIFTILFVIFVTGMVYLMSGVTYSEKFVGILHDKDIREDTSCTTSCSKNSDGSKNCHTSCHNYYYIEELFKKNTNSSSICTVTRIKYYTIKADANNKLEHVKLQTSRTLYRVIGSPHECYDDQIRKYYTTIGSILIGLSLIVPVGIFIAFIYEMISETCKGSQLIRKEIPLGRFSNEV